MLRPLTTTMSRLSYNLGQKGQLNLPGITFASKKLTEDLLLKDSENHHGLFRASGFHNHLSHQWAGNYYRICIIYWHRVFQAFWQRMIWVPCLITSGKRQARLWASLVSLGRRKDTKDEKTRRLWEVRYMSPGDVSPSLGDSQRLPKTWPHLS